MEKWLTDHSGKWQASVGWSYWEMVVAKSNTIAAGRLWVNSFFTEIAYLHIMYYLIYRKSFSWC